jgi:O-methyltransferase
VYTGVFAAQINSLFPKRSLYLFDTFEGFDSRDVSVEQEHGYSNARPGTFEDTSKELVRLRLPYPDQAIFRKGYFPETATGVAGQFALVSIDADLYKPIYEGLRFFYPRLSRRGCIIVHDFNNAQFKGAGEAVRQYCSEEGITPVPLCDLHGSAVIVK